MPKARQHGGKREGAGRKIGPDGPVVIVTVSVPKSLVESLDHYMAQEKCSKSEAVTRAIRGLVGK
jgi:hypothetical protein